MWGGSPRTAADALVGLSFEPDQGSGADEGVRPTAELALVGTP
jgi:hypothetical protein